MIWVARAASEIVGVKVSTAAAPAASSGAAALGFTVMIGMPRVTVAVTL
jgi:hypothetical protein